MSERPAGYYPDPDGENRHRYWDGDSWTDYYTPLPSSAPVIHGPKTAVHDYPYLACVPQPAMPPTSDPGLPATGWPVPAAGPQREAGETMEFGRTSSRWPVLVIVAFGVIALAAVGALAARALSG